MLQDMYSFPWSYPPLTRKGVDIWKQYNAELCWLSVNAVYFPHSILEFAKQIGNPASFVTKFKNDKVHLSSKDLYEEEIVIKQIDLEVELEKNHKLLLDLRNALLG